MHSERQYGTNSPPDRSPVNYSPPGVTPGADNLSTAAAGGGISGIALGVAGAHERESGVQALRDISNWGNSGSGIAGPRAMPVDRSATGSPFEYDHLASPPPVQQHHSYSSTVPLAPAGALSPATANRMSGSEHTSERSIPLDGTPVGTRTYPYQDSPYNRYSSSNLDLATGINPNELPDDDDDWGMAVPTTNNKRRSFNPFHSHSREGTPSTTNGGAAVAAGAGAGLVVGSAAAMTRDPSGHYNAVPGGDNGSAERIAAAEKSEWLEKQTTRNHRLKWIVGTIIAFVVVGAIVGGVLGGVLGRKKDGSSGGGGNSGSNSVNAGSVAEDNRNDLGKNSKEIQALLNNKDLHKVFPGMDYTPLNVQYPECIHVPPSQNNITRDMAVLSQLTNAVRLYGTDCNQTQMVLHAIDRLELKDMKIWLGVWIDSNDTTTERQLSQLYEILDLHAEDKFKGVIVGNEVLFRKDITELQLIQHLKDVKSNLTSRGINLPVATSDLGDNWTAQLANQVEVVMSNIHPFFAGVTAEKAAGWTWDFWTNHDVVLTKGTNIKQVISEVGWPSKGGNNCGPLTCETKTEGSVAGIDEMNTFMEDWVCASLDNGTDYFW